MKLIQPTYLSGKLFVQGSKSHFIRAGLCSLFNQSEKLIISNISKCDDDLAVIELLKSLGLDLIWANNSLTISGSVKHCPKEINSGESGLLSRMLFSLYSLFSQDYQITGSGTLLNREMFAEEESLKSIGLNTKSQNKHLPMRISGELKTGEYFLDGSSGSQFLSGALLAFSQLSETNSQTILNVENLKSKPYIDLTIKTLANFGVEIENYDYRKFIIKSNQRLFSEKIEIESDWSSASYFIVGGILSGDLELSGLDFLSTQADRKILDLFNQVGIKYKSENDKLFIWKQNYNGFTFSSEDCPDLIPILIVLALNAGTSSQISGANRLKNKESNRADVLIKEFAKLGVDINLSGDNFLITPQIIKSGKIDSHSDHRIAMAFSIAGIVSGDGIEIENPECVSKSYPNFYKDFESLKNINGQF
jgi:3-phosphoshikimate 1-carboxyvinyltransferase